MADIIIEISYFIPSFYRIHFSTKIDSTLLRGINLNETSNQCYAAENANALLLCWYNLLYGF